MGIPAGLRAASKVHAGALDRALSRLAAGGARNPHALFMDGMFFVRGSLEKIIAMRYQGRFTAEILSYQFLAWVSRYVRETPGLHTVVVMFDDKRPTSTRRMPMSKIGRAYTPRPGASEFTKTIFSARGCTEVVTSILTGLRCMTYLPKAVSNLTGLKLYLDIPHVLEGPAAEYTEPILLTSAAGGRMAMTPVPSATNSVVEADLKTVWWIHWMLHHGPARTGTIDGRIRIRVATMDTDAVGILALNMGIWRKSADLEVYLMPARSGNGRIVPMRTFLGAVCGGDITADKLVAFVTAMVACKSDFCDKWLYRVSALNVFQAVSRGTIGLWRPPPKGSATPWWTCDLDRLATGLTGHLDARNAAKVNTEDLRKHAREAGRNIGYWLQYWRLTPDHHPPHAARTAGAKRKLE